ncbi:transposase [Maribacter sp. IgM3_T14_3]|uniref:transposase n=1 Tax=Maribacter sp. IgM3_T14_3 TaxID=3415140 RepID=UPI003C6EBB0E
MQIWKGVVSKDYVYVCLEYRPSQDVSTFVKKLKVRSSGKLYQNFPEMRKKLWRLLLGNKL